TPNSPPEPAAPPRPVSPPRMSTQSCLLSPATPRAVPPTETPRPRAVHAHTQSRTPKYFPAAVGTGSLLSLRPTASPHTPHRSPYSPRQSPPPAEARCAAPPSCIRQ